MTSQERSQVLADKLQPLLMVVDIFVQELEDEDFELLEESKNILKNHISLQHSAITLTMAFGINTDTFDEEYKLKTLEQLIEFLKIRRNYYEDMKKHLENQKNIEQNRKELMNIFGNL